MKRTNKPTKNFQKKKYYTKDLKKTPTKKYPDLDGTFVVDPQTWEVKYTPPAPYKKGQDFVPK